MIVFVLISVSSAEISVPKTAGAGTLISANETLIIAVLIAPGAQQAVGAMNSERMSRFHSGVLLWPKLMR